MELSFFRDKLFDLINESDEIQLADLNADEKHQLLIAKTEDGATIEILCRKVEDL